MMKIPFNKIPISGNELNNIRLAMESGYLQGGGAFMKVCEEKILAATSAKATLLTTSCTSAQDISAILCDIKPGDEVIIPSYTFVSTVNSFALRGAKPVFCDVKPETLNIDESKIEELITPRTKAISPVHYAGVGCEMDAICEIARKNNLRVIEDAAQGFMAYYKNRHLGTIGDLGSLSFHSTKNVIAGECGALLVNDPELIERANIVREKGTNRIQFVQGKIDKYTWVDYGSSYIPSEIISAFLAAQLEIAKDLTDKRVEAWNYYYAQLKDLDANGKFALAKVPEYCRHNAHIFFLDAFTPERKSALEKHLKERGISAMSHYAPLHSCPMAKKLGCSDVSLPVAERMAATMLRLPIFSAITRQEQDYVCEALRDFFDKQ